MEKFELPKRFRRLWIVHLESGLFNQTKSCLIRPSDETNKLDEISSTNRKEHAYCCLGLAATQFCKLRSLINIGYITDLNHQIAIKNQNELYELKLMINKEVRLDEYPEIMEWLYKNTNIDAHVFDGVCGSRKSLEHIFANLNDQFNLTFGQIAEFIKKFTKGI